MKLHPFTRSALVLGLALVSVAACTDSPTGITTPDENALSPETMKGAVYLSIDATAGTASFGAPSARSGVAGGPSYSLIGSSEISYHLVGFRRGVSKGRNVNDTIALDFRLQNDLGNSDLVPSTYPAPPVPDSLILVAVGMRLSPDSTKQPGYGLMWRGRTQAVETALRWNVLSGNMCRTGPSCAPWIPLAPIRAHGTSGTVSMSFLIPKSASGIEGYMFLAADVQDATLPPNTGAIAGTLSSNVGPLAHIAVIADSAHQDTTSANGTYAIGELKPGSYTVKFQVPDYCYVPDTTVTVTAGIVTKLDRSGVCQAMIVGRVTTISPTSGLVVGEPNLFMYVNGADAGLTGPTGRYTAYATPGLVTFDIKDPAGCGHQSPAPFTIAAGQTDTINITVTCLGTVRGIVTANSGPAAGAAVTLTLGGSTFTTTSASDGSYAFPNVAGGINGTLFATGALAPWCQARGVFNVKTATTQADLALYCTPAPVVLTQALPHGQSGFPYGPVQLVANADSGLTWHVSDNGTTGLVVSPAGVVSGMAAGEGTSLIVVQVGDQWGRHSEASIYITIDIVAPQVITTTLPTATIGVPYTAQLAGYGRGLRWLTDPAFLPAGLTLSLDGVLSGTPRGPAAVSLLSVKLVDQFGNSTTTNLSLTVRNP